MLRNLFETDVREATEFLDWKMIPYVLVAFGSAALVTRVQLQTPYTLKQTVYARVKYCGLALVLAVIGTWPITNELIPAFRQHKELRYLITPSNYIVSSFRVLGDELVSPTTADIRHPIAVDAHLHHPQEVRKPTAVVMVVGETVRAANWGLNGYTRDTTPTLAARDIINFSEVTSCGTDTATSVPCMFSIQGRHAYKESTIRRSESLLHVLSRAGVEVLWRDNQAGCKGVCEGLAYEDLSNLHEPDVCRGKRCFDEILLSGLKEKIESTRGDAFIVLHMLGNHGPAYFQRYPDAFRRWEPTCDTADLSTCPHDALINTYDNAILYTDHVLSQAIDLLSSLTTHDTALIYVSDHGESLGEKGLYLHGMPYAIAPAEQTHVPMIQWFSPSFVANRHINLECLRTRASRPLSHDYLFHTVLKLLELDTESYDEKWDLLAGC